MVVDLASEGKCVVLLSGGPDSATVAYWAKNRGYEVHAMSCKYGQIATREIESAVHLARKLDAPLKIVDLSSLREFFAGVSSVCDEKIPMTSTFSQPIIVPFRNAIFLSTAVAHAVGIGASVIFYGAQGSDAPFYPDCRKEFYESFQTTARLGTGQDLIVQAPFSQTSKSELIKLGVKLGVPFELTWSCYLNGPRHCGTCESCVNRRKAFREAGVADPTDYSTQ